MAGSKEIRNKIKSVQNTRKITKAMEMVAASKMKKAQDRMRASRPYVSRMLAIARHLSHANPEYRHPFVVKRGEPKNVGLIVITTDKGLCGGLNTNALRLALSMIKAWQAKGGGSAGHRPGQQGPGLHESAEGERRFACRGLGRSPAPRQADRAGQGPARCLHRRTDR